MYTQAVFQVIDTLLAYYSTYDIFHVSVIVSLVTLRGPMGVQDQKLFFVFIFK